MNKTINLFLIAIMFILSIGLSAEESKNIKEKEIKDLKIALADAKRRINGADTYRWKDSLRFLPSVSVSRRGVYDQMNSEGTETYLSASVSLNQFYDMTDIADKKNAERRKAIRRVESLGYSIEKLIERKYLLTEQIWKMRQIAKSIEEPIEAANRQEKADQLQLQLNETFIEIERMFAEVEYVCVEVEG
jgi:hypothetical protein